MKIRSIYHNWRHIGAQILSSRLIVPEPRDLFVSVTAHCNYACQGCNYGRGFMTGHELPLPIVRNLLTDAKELGFERVRIYGGEPLLHPDLVAMVEHSTRIGLQTSVTTNGALLGKKIGPLYEAGLRRISIGLYGTGDDYDAYVQRPNRFDRLDNTLSRIRDKYGSSIKITLAWVLMRPTCSLESVHDLWRFAEKHDTPIHINLIHYSLPYFNEGPDQCLQLFEYDRETIERVLAELIKLKKKQPHLLTNSIPDIRAIPDWLIRKAEMKIPCTRYRLIWIGADGTVQLCYVTFPLGNLHENRLRDLLFTPEHVQASRDCFDLKCPNCHCDAPERIRKFIPARIRYSAPSFDRGYK